jgi:hypothetical protein
MTQPIVLDPSLTKAGFFHVRVKAQKRLVLCTCAREKAGKTHFAFTAPGPIAAVATDTGTEEVAGKFLSSKQIILSMVDVSDIDNQDEAQREWEKLSGAIIAGMDNPKIRTLVVDTGTEVYETLRLAKFGKISQVKPHHYVEVNKIMRNLIKRAYQREDLNCIWIHKQKKEYKQNKKGDDSWTGRYEFAGFGDAPYLVDMKLEHYFVDPTGEEPGRFGARVVGVSRQTPDVTGLELEGDGIPPDRLGCNFPSLASMVYPELPVEYWL